ncbi:MAG: COX15/CtaA family protein [Thermodesulfobacteriota bacterium]
MIKEGRSSKMAYVLGTSVICIYLLMIMGTLVTSTGSGLACPDWPLCYGSIRPPLQLNIWFEWGHRLLGAVAALLISLSTFFVWRNFKGTPRFLTGAILALLLSGILLGGVIVLIEAPILDNLLHTAIISSHLIISTLVLIGLVFTFRYVVVRKNSFTSRGLHPLIFGMLYFQVILGILVRYSGATAACPDFPLCLGEIIPAFTHYTITLHFLHRIGALIVFLLTCFNLYKSIREMDGVFASAITFGLVLLQGLFGISIVLTGMFLPFIILHGATGFFLLGWLAYLSMPYLFSTHSFKERRMTI